MTRQWRVTPAFVIPNPLRFWKTRISAIIVRRLIFYYICIYIAIEILSNPRSAGGIGWKFSREMLKRLTPAKISITKLSTFPIANCNHDIGRVFEANWERAKKRSGGESPRDQLSLHWNLGLNYGYNRISIKYLLPFMWKLETIYSRH